MTMKEEVVFRKWPTCVGNRFTKEALRKENFSRWMILLMISRINLDLYEKYGSCLKVTNAYQ